MTTTGPRQAKDDELDVFRGLRGTDSPAPMETAVEESAEDALAQPPVFGERGLRALDAAFGRLDRALRTIIPEALDPLAQTGAVANVCLLVAIATGGLLLFWYTPSVQGAHASLEAVEGLTAGQLVRSLHRYSSDACMLFVLLHALQALGRRALAGPRKLAWVTGAVLLCSLWLTGWLGYWLVWDQRAQAVAVGSARFLDALGGDPVMRSFLTDGAVSSQLFFVVFFAHMLLPLPMAVALWLHITRLSRARFLTGRPLALWIVVSLLVVSVAAPATSTVAATMTVAPTAFTMDWWYLLPLVLTDRLGGGALWAVACVGGVAIVGLPWWLVRRGRAGSRAAVAEVKIESCNDCRLCARDCPYEAISMVPRTDGRNREAQAEVDPARCVGCGICTGSCDSAAMNLPWLTTLEQRRRLDTWLETPSAVAFVCAEAAGDLAVESATGRTDVLPGWRVMAVPCAGAVHALTVERALRRGAERVLVVGCPQSSCGYREGSRWEAMRLEGRLDPPLRTDRVDADRVAYVELARGDRAGLLAAARSEGQPPPPAPTPVRRVAATLAFVVALLLATWLPSTLPYATAADGEPHLVVSFKHAGAAKERCRELSAEELAEKPAHMRQPRVCERERAAVTMVVVVDGTTVVERRYEPSGLFGDGSSVALEKIPLAPGAHRVEVTIDDGDRRHHEVRGVELTEGAHRVLLFDKATGFAWH